MSKDIQKMSEAEMRFYIHMSHNRRKKMPLYKQFWDYLKHVFGHGDYEILIDSPLCKLLVCRQCGRQKWVSYYNE